MKTGKIPYSDHMIDSFLFSESKRYDVKGRAYFNYPNKYYCEDVGHRNARIGFRQPEMMHIVENIQSAYAMLTEENQKSKLNPFSLTGDPFPKNHSQTRHRQKIL